MRFEVLTREDAENARLAGEKLLYWDRALNLWIDRPNPRIECDSDTLYRIKPQPKTIRKPLPDLRVLVGAMLVWPNGGMSGIARIKECGNEMVVWGGGRYTAQMLMDGNVHCQWHGNTPQPCWTEEEVEG